MSGGGGEEADEAGGYFFGEDYRVFGNQFHVVTAAWFFLFLEFLVLCGHVVIIPLSVSSFDATSVVQILMCGSALLCALVEMLRHGHALFWPFIIVKLILCFLLVSVMSLLTIVGRKTLLQLVRWKFKTVNQSNEWLHVGILFSYFCLQIVYAILALKVVYAVAEYYKNRAISKYEFRRKLVIRNLV